LFLCCFVRDAGCDEDYSQLKLLWTSDDPEGAFSILTKRAVRKFTFPPKNASFFVDELERDGLLDLLPDNDGFLNWLRKRPRTCAIVGNSGILNRQGFGDEIDSHDVTLRFNMAPTVSFFARDVGHKTSILMLNYDKALMVIENSTLLAPYHGLQWLVINPHDRLVNGPHKIVADIRLFLEFTRNITRIERYAGLRIGLLSDVWKVLSRRVLIEEPPSAEEALVLDPKPSSGLKVRATNDVSFSALFICILF
jgi:hypothetical protein